MVTAGLRLLPRTATPGVVAPPAGNLSDRIGERWIPASGPTLQAAGPAGAALAVLSRPGAVAGGCAPGRGRSGPDHS